MSECVDARNYLPRDYRGYLKPTYVAVRPEKLFRELYGYIRDPISAEIVSEVHNLWDTSWTTWFIIVHTKVCVHAIEIRWAPHNSFSQERIVRKVFAGFIMRHWGVSRGIEPFVQADHAWWWRCKHRGLHYGDPDAYNESYKDEDLVAVCQGLICVCDDTEQRNLSWRKDAAAMLLGICKFRKTLLNVTAPVDVVRIIAQMICTAASPH